MVLMIYVLHEIRDERVEWILIYQGECPLMRKFGLEFAAAFTVASDK